MLAPFHIEWTRKSASLTLGNRPYGSRPAHSGAGAFSWPRSHRAAEKGDELAPSHEHGPFFCTDITRSHGLREGASGVEL